MGADSPPRPPTPEEAARITAIRDSLRAAHPPRLDSIRNGADDDGSGTVSILEIAEAMAGAKHPRRSILFVNHTGEESGLVGSAWFTDHPTVPIDSIVAEIDQDMVGRGTAQDLPEAGPTYLEVVGAKRVSKEFGEILEATNAAQPKPFVFNYTYDAPGHPLQYYCRADHYNYARYTIPAVAFSRGEHLDYHQVTDEPQYIDYDDMARVTRAGVRCSPADREPRSSAGSRHPEGRPARSLPTVTQFARTARVAPNARSSTRGGRGGPMYDAIVIGARCGGAATAMLLARKGHRVLLVDRAVFPSDIPHGHLDSPRRAEAARELGTSRSRDRHRMSARSRRCRSDLGDFSLAATDLSVDGVPGRVRTSSHGARSRARGRGGRGGSRASRRVLRRSADDGWRSRHRHSRRRSSSRNVGHGARDDHDRRGRSQLARRARGRRRGVRAGAVAHVLVLQLLGGRRRATRSRSTIGTGARSSRSRRTTTCSRCSSRGRSRSWRSCARTSSASSSRRVDGVPSLGERVRAGRRADRFYGATDLRNFLRKPYGPGWALVGDAGCHKDPYLALGICRRVS